MKAASNILIYSLLLLLCTPLTAQQLVSGKVIDKYSGEIIGRADIYARNFQGQEIAKTESNKYTGSFELVFRAGRIVLEIQKEGYKTLSVPVAQGTNLGVIELTRELSFDTEIVDSRTGKPLSEYTLYILPRDPGRPTDSIAYNCNNSPKEDCRLSRAITEDYDSLLITSPDYESLHISLDLIFGGERSIPKKLSLVRNQFNYLRTNLRTAGKQSQQITEIPASVVLITREDIKRQGYVHLEDLLEQVAGIYLFKDYSWSGGDPILGVRGFASEGFNNNVLMLVNGVNQYEDYWGFYPFSRLNIPVEAIDRIEYIRGPLSVIYGSGAFFGAINIITNEAPEPGEKVESSLQTTVSSNEGRRIAAVLGTHTEDMGLHFNGQYRSTRGLNKPFSDFTSAETQGATTGGLLERESYYFNLSTNYRIPLGTSDSLDREQSLQVGIEAGLSGESREVFESAVSTANTFCACPIPVSWEDAPGSLNRSNSAYASLRLSYQPRDSLYLSGFVNYYSYRTSIDYASGGNNYGFSTWYSNSMESELSASYTTRGFDLLAGVNARYVTDLITTFDIPSGSLQDGNEYIRLRDTDNLLLASVYAQASRPINKRLTLLAGFRVEDLNEFVIESKPAEEDSTNFIFAPNMTDIGNQQPVFIPRAALLFKINEEQVVKLLYGESTKRPAFGNFTDNAALLPARMQTLELNYVGEVRPGKKKATYKGRPLHTLIFNSSVYYNILNNLIKRVSTVDANNQSVFISQNAGEVVTLGFEGGLAYRNARDFRADVNINFNRSSLEFFQEIINDNGNGEVQLFQPELAFSPSLLAYVRLSKKVSERLPLWVGLNYRYVSRTVPDVSFDEFGNETPNGVQIDGYHVPDISLQIESFRFGKERPASFWDQAYLDILLSNLSNADVRYPTTGNTSSWADRGTPGYGRRVFVTFGLRFQ